MRDNDRRKNHNGRNKQRARRGNWNENSNQENDQQRRNQGGVENPQKKDELIYVGSTKNTRKEHSKQKMGPKLYPLGLNKKKPKEDTVTSNTSRDIRSYVADKLTYANIVKNS